MNFALAIALGLPLYSRPLYSTKVRIGIDEAGFCQHFAIMLATALRQEEEEWDRPPTLPEPFHQFVHEELTNPIIMSSPHSGRFYPTDLQYQSALTLDDLRRLEDAYVDELIEPCLHHNVQMITAQYGRAYVDLNRSPKELDPSMFSSDEQIAHIHTPRVRAGLGCLPRIGACGRAIYNRRLQLNQADRRLKAIYHPYHRALKEMISQTTATLGSALVLDCHSMPSNAHGFTMHEDFVIGDNNNKAAESELSATIISFLQRQGFQVGHNKPYAGGFITQTYGKPARQVSALQIEINRKLYLDENAWELNDRFDELQSILAEMVDMLIGYFDQKKAAPEKVRL